MPDDWEDDDWEQADLSLPKAGEEAKAEWSDEEAHDADAEEAKPARAAPPPAPPKEKTGLELKIEAREKREAEEANRMAELRAKAGVSTEVSASPHGSSALPPADDDRPAGPTGPLRHAPGT